MPSSAIRGGRVAGSRRQRDGRYRWLALVLPEYQVAKRGLHASPKTPCSWWALPGS
jgi:hypothetical protein